MFDISFSELMVIAVVALIVIGPEKLPKVARTAGAFFGRMQRFVAQVKDEVNRESRFQELQQLQEEVKSSLQQGMDEVSHGLTAIDTVPGMEGSASVLLTKEVSVAKPRARKPRAVDAQKETGTAVKRAVRKRRDTGGRDAVATEENLPIAPPSASVTVRKPRAPRKKSPSATS